MTISVINSISPLTSQLDPAATQGATQDAQVSFTKVFDDIVENAQQTEKTAQDGAKDLAMGQIDDLHTVMINSAKAELALVMLVQVRNKALDAYNEVMRMSV